MDTKIFPGFVYNPLAYAWEAHRDYLQRGGAPGKRFVLLGMNPGPWGMMQTGVPFGEVAMVRDWLGIRGTIAPPERQHPARPILGWECHRSEVSGRRLWGWVRDRYDSPDAFFAEGMVLNYCPLAFLGETGRNLTPDKFPGTVTADLYEVCDRFLRDAVAALEPAWVLGVGKFALGRIREVFGENTSFGTGSILHPSPASPAANRDWAGTVDRQLRDLGVW